MIRAPAALAVVVALSAGPLGAQAGRPLAFDAGWALSGEGARIETWQGVEALRMRNGGAIRRDADFRDGTVEFDLSMAGHRSFVYLKLRLDPDGDGEELYFGPHKSSLPDAVQCTPAWNGESNWQLFHGAWGTAPATFRRDAWMLQRLDLGYSDWIPVFLAGRPVFTGDARYSYDRPAGKASSPSARPRSGSRSFAATTRSCSRYRTGSAAGVSWPGSIPRAAPAW